MYYKGTRNFITNINITKFFSIIAADPCTLLSTQRKYLLKPISSGYDYHFGIIQKIHDAFTVATGSPNGNIIYLQNNIL